LKQNAGGENDTRKMGGVRVRVLDGRK